MCDPVDDLAYPVDESFRLLGRRWGPEIITQVSRGMTRYSQLQKVLPGISPRTLSVRILEFRKAGLISKTGNEVRVSYALTRKGKEFVKELDSVAAFSIRWHGVASGTGTAKRA
jgi:DNA-binding HxlR family transcriptional regulator